MSNLGTRALTVLTGGAVLLTLLLAACGGTSAISTSVAVAVGTTTGAATPGTPGGTPRPGASTPQAGIVPAFGTQVAGGPLATAAAGLPTIALPSNIPLPSGIPGLGGLRSGTFENKSKSGAGRVDIVPGPLGTVVNFGLDFSVTNGPQLRVYLTKEASPSNKAEVDRGFVDLGALQATAGIGIYTVPNGTNLNDYKGVIIYSTQENAVYAAAKLSAP